MVQRYRLDFLGMIRKLSIMVFRNIFGVFSIDYRQFFFSCIGLQEQVCRLIGLEVVGVGRFGELRLGWQFEYIRICLGGVVGKQLDVFKINWVVVFVVRGGFEDRFVFFVFWCGFVRRREEGRKYKGYFFGSFVYGMSYVIMGLGSSIGKLLCVGVYFLVQSLFMFLRFVVYQEGVF